MFKNGMLRCVCLLGTGAALFAEDGTAGAADESSGGDSIAAAVNEVISAEVDWMQELMNGGNTAIALIVLFFAMIAFAVERAVRLRRSVIIPADLVSEVKLQWHEGKFEEIQAACAKRPSVMSKMVDYVVEHREADPELLIPGTSDIAVRELKAHNQRAFSLAVIAGLAPLLGLLGTMIGMIESFKLVEQYGDEGGASMLAGSISKALITTAVGLIIAIPSLALYHFFKFRCNNLGTELDEEMEVLINAWLLKKTNPAEQATVASNTESANGDMAADAAVVAS